MSLNNSITLDSEMETSHPQILILSFIQSVQTSILCQTVPVLSNLNLSVHPHTSLDWYSCPKRSFSSISQSFISPQTFLFRPKALSQSIYQPYNVGPVTTKSPSNVDITSTSAPSTKSVKKKTSIETRGFSSFRKSTSKTTSSAISKKPAASTSSSSERTSNTAESSSPASAHEKSLTSKLKSTDSSINSTSITTTIATTTATTNSSASPLKKSTNSKLKSTASTPDSVTPLTSTTSTDSNINTTISSTSGKVKFTKTQSKSGKIQSDSADSQSISTQLQDNHQQRGKSDINSNSLSTETQQLKSKQKTKTKTSIKAPRKAKDTDETSDSTGKDMNHQHQHQDTHKDQHEHQHDNEYEIQDKPHIQKSRAKTKSKPKSAKASSSKQTQEKELSSSDASDSDIVFHPKQYHSRAFVLKVGDLVVHKRYGYGKFKGLQLVQNEFIIQELAIFEYADGNLSVLTTQLDLFSPIDERYDDVQPHLDELAKHFDENFNKKYRMQIRAQNQTREQIRQQVSNMYQAYEARNTCERTPFPPSIKDEARLADGFGYPLTKDQHKSLNEIYGDLSYKTKPMDRLLCGDVGFGKTEVSIRVATRVLLAGKQVIMIAPTTILTHQHYKTFQERLAPVFPHINIAVLTRFVSKEQRAKNVNGLKDGTVNLLIGTHAALQDSVEFKDIGLLIIDEEHRFGVNQKEKIRNKFPHLDVLSLSATPIPRTLHMSITGLRDISVLGSPPSGRLSIDTKVSPMFSSAIKEYIERELDRNGQVFYVVPHIKHMADAETRLQVLVPSARIMLANGEMRDLEQRILDFSDGKAEILLCTTIIENGIDLPRVNTIIVQDAVRLGLAQLHQLRGRVGRGSTQGYALLLHTTHDQFSELGRERLQVLAEMSGLGSGFDIARRDMEMRGIGRVLGVEQSGRTVLPSEEFSSILYEELELARVDSDLPPQLPKTDSVEIQLSVSCYIPSTYIPDVNMRTSIYGRLARAKDIHELNLLCEMIKGRLGPFPPEIELYFKVMKLKHVCIFLGISSVHIQREHVALVWNLHKETAEVLLKVTERDTNLRRRLNYVDHEGVLFVRGLAIMKGEMQVEKLYEWLSLLMEPAMYIRDEWERRAHDTEHNPFAGVKKV